MSLSRVRACLPLFSSQRNRAVGERIPAGRWGPPVDVGGVGPLVKILISFANND